MIINLLFERAYKFNNIFWKLIIISKTKTIFIFENKTITKLSINAGKSTSQVSYSVKIPAILRPFFL